MDALTEEMNQFVYDYIERNGKNIAEKVYGLDISKQADEDIWFEILGDYDKALNVDQYIKIDTLANLTG